MADENISISLTVDGADRAASNLGAVSAATDRVDASTKKAGGSLADAGVKWNTFGSTIGLVGRGIAAQNQTLGRMVTVLGTAVGSIGTLSAAMGPLGLVIGVASTAFTLYQQATAGATRETDGLRRAADQLIPTLDSLVSKIEQAEAARARMGRVLTGGGTGAERMAVQQRLAAQQSASTVTPQRPGETDSDYARRVEQREALDRQTRELVGEAVSSPPRGGVLADFRSPEDRARAVASAQAAEARRRSAGSGRGGGGRRRGGGSDALFGPVQADFGASAGTADDASLSSFLSQTARGGDALGVRAEADDRRDALRSLDDEAERQHARDQDRSEERMKTLGELAAIGETVGTAIFDVFEQVASGEATLAQAMENLFKQSLVQLAKSETIEAMKSFAQALGYAAAFDYPSAGQAAAAGGLHLLAAAAAGGAGAAMGAFSKPSVGGGGKGGNARPESARGASSGGGGPSTIVVNLPANTVLAGTYADAGVAIGRCTREALRTYGRAL